MAHLRWDSPTPTGVVDDLASGAAWYDDFWGESNDGPWYLVNWLVVSTQLKNISQNGNLPQVGVQIKNIWNHHLVNGLYSLYIKIVSPLNSLKTKLLSNY